MERYKMGFKTKQQINIPSYNIRILWLNLSETGNQFFDNVVTANMLKDIRWIKKQSDTDVTNNLIIVQSLLKSCVSKNV